jgi:hypothetical protein
MYDIAFGSLCKSIGCTLGLGGHLLLFRELVAALPYKYSYPTLFFMPLFAPRLPVDRFVSVLCVWVLLEEELLKFHFNEVTLGYLALKLCRYAA